MDYQKDYSICESGSDFLAQILFLPVRFCYYRSFGWEVEFGFVQRRDELHVGKRKRMPCTTRQRGKEEDQREDM